MIPTDEIISMTKEAGFEFYGQRWDNQGHEVIYTAGDFAIARFAALVSARAAKDAREACAKVCDVEAEYWRDLLAMGCAEASDICATEIRSRKP